MQEYCIFGWLNNDVVEANNNDQMVGIMRWNEINSPACDLKHPLTGYMDFIVIVLCSCGALTVMPACVAAFTESMT